MAGINQRAEASYLKKEIGESARFALNSENSSDEPISTRSQGKKPAELRSGLTQSQNLQAKMKEFLTKETEEQDKKFQLGALDIVTSKYGHREEKKELQKPKVERPNLEFRETNPSKWEGSGLETEVPREQYVNPVQRKKQQKDEFGIDRGMHITLETKKEKRGSNLKASTLQTHYESKPLFEKSSTTSK